MNVSGHKIARDYEARTHSWDIDTAEGEISHMASWLLATMRMCTAASPQFHAASTWLMPGLALSHMYTPAMRTD